MSMAASPSLALLEASTSVSQGAEARIYKGYLHAPPSGEPDAAAAPVLLKHRFTKGYRHASLDSALTRSRVAGEARALVRCLRAGVNVPAVRMVDAETGLLGIEWIEGRSVRGLLGGGAEDEEELPGDGGEGEDADGPEPETEGPEGGYGISKGDIMQLIGNEIAKMHLVDIVHGDLTTSNMMLRHPSATKTSKADLVLIDFGLAYTSTLVEDKAVDLYVLERAFASTHPESEALFASALNAYQTRMGSEWKAIGRRLDEVRLRGRKRSMVG